MNVTEFLAFVEREAGTHDRRRVRRSRRPPPSWSPAWRNAARPFALQLRERIARLIRELPHDDPAWIAGARAMAVLELLAFTGEQRGDPRPPDLPPLKSVGPPPPALPHTDPDPRHAAPARVLVRAR